MIDRDALLETVRANQGKLDKKELARRLKIRGEERRDLRRLLDDLVHDGVLLKTDRRTYRTNDAVPDVMVINIVEIDDQGDLIGVPAKWRGATEALRLIVREDHSGKKGKSKAELSVGSKALCKIKQKGEVFYADVLKHLGSGPKRQLGLVFETGRGLRIKPVAKKSRERDEVGIAKGHNANLNDLVVYEVGDSRHKGLKLGKIVEVLGSADNPKAGSLISLYQHGVQIGFDPDVVKEAKALKLPGLDKYREDLRELPLLTIDPVDAKDFDDAIYAEPKDDGGHVCWVAIADVAAFVKPGSKLDKSAYRKGNSTYLPDRVEPMLPEELSADLCSLRPHEDRACMAVRMEFDTNGKKTGHKFVRGIMRSHARLTYAQAQEAFDGKPGEVAQTVYPILQDIQRAYKTMLKARLDRGPLAINVPERKVKVNDKGAVESITIRESLEANRLIEEFMVQANVCAAQTLEAKSAAAVHRQHEPPDYDKLQGLTDFLPALGLKWSMGERATTHRFNQLLEKAEEKDLSETVGMSVLRTQSQAVYSPESSGHFGLNLTHYAHFTSPIRRYADLVVHRALIKALNLGDDGISGEELSRLKETAEHISDTERASMAAERDAKDRYVAQYLEGRVGGKFSGWIAGIAGAGLFVQLDETGADGFVPVRTLGRDYFIFDEKRKSLIGRESGDTFRFGQRVDVKLVEATPVTGGLIFEMLSEPEKGKPQKSRGGYSKTGRHGSGRQRSGGGKGGGQGKSSGNKTRGKRRN